MLVVNTSAEVALEDHYFQLDDEDEIQSTPIQHPSAATIGDVLDSV
jgi:hypothetical protein